MIDTGDIYMITNILDNKKYIGQAKSYLSSGRKNGANIRWKHHINRGLRNESGCPYLYNAIKKYGVENFKMEKAPYIKEIKYEKERFNEDIENFDITDKYTNVNDLIRENESKLKKLFIEYVKNHKYFDVYDLNNVKI